jgi:hypothetical protein
MALDVLDLGEFLAANVGQFAPTELQISDGLSAYLSGAQDVAPEDMAVVVDMDGESPLAKFEENLVYGRFNGRYSIPKFTQTGAEVKADMAAWIELTKQWCQENGVQYHFDDESKQVVKFTAFVPVFDLSGAVEEAPTEEPAEEEPSEESAPTEEAPTEEPAEEEPSEDDQKSAKELEDKLNS